MQRLARLLISICVTITALICGAILVGRGHSEPSTLETLGFGTCQGKPCFIGIAPGVTKWDGLKENVAQKQEVRSVFSLVSIDQEIDFGTEHFLGSVRNDISPSIVTIMVIATLPDKRVIRLRDVVQIYGFPCAVSSGVTGHELLLMYPFMNIKSETPNNRLDIEAPIDRITMVNGDVTAPQYKTQCTLVKKTQTAWIGFASLENYQSHGLWWVKQ
jgi:hypothetical protein